MIPCVSLHCTCPTQHQYATLPTVFGRTGSTLVLFFRRMCSTGSSLVLFSGIPECCLYYIRDQAWLGQEQACKGVSSGTGKVSIPPFQNQMMLQRLKIKGSGCNISYLSKIQYMLLHYLFLCFNGGFIDTLLVCCYKSCNSCIGPKYDKESLYHGK